MPEDCAPLVTWLASDAAAEVTGQAIGIGGDALTLYTHPAEARVELRNGGWTAETIDAAWREGLSELAQPSGVSLPALELA
jgi:3-oxoacyl-[acyl-carrier protein] reductase